VSTVNHPTAVVVSREEPKRDKRWSPQVNLRLPVLIRPQTAPEPVPYTSFYGVGRDPAHARAHIWRYQSLAIADKLAIMAPNFLIKKIPSALVVGQPKGIALPVSGRSNIESPGRSSLGSQTAVRADTSWNPDYLKLL
jgi:hypothetical protein